MALHFRGFKSLNSMLYVSFDVHEKHLFISKLKLWVSFGKNTRITANG